MIIGIDASQANTKERTGTEWYAFHIIEEWMRANAFKEHVVRLYVREELQDDFPALPEHWEVVVLRWPPKIFWSQLRLSIEMILRRVDALFVPAHTIPLKHAKHTFTTIHDVGFESNPEVYSRKSIVRISSPILQKCISGLIRICTLGRYGANELDYQRFGVRYALKHAEKIFTVSEFSKREIDRFFGMNHPPIQVAYNGIEQNVFTYPFSLQEIQRVQRAYQLNHYILTIGRIEKKKNSHLLAEAFLKYCDTHPKENIDLIFAGPDGHGAAEVRRLIKRSAHQNRVHFLGWVPQADIAPLLAGASLFVFLSAYEGFGVPLIQSLAVGTPVVASNLPVFKEIGNGFISTCDPADTDACAALLHAVLTTENSDLSKKEMSAHAASFSWKNTADTIAREISKTLAL